MGSTAKPTAALILAAGEGKRMRSSLPKVLHACGDKPLVAHVVELALKRKCNPVVLVIGPKGARIREALVARFPKAPLVFAVQPEPLGTGDAARAGLVAIPKFKGRVLILYGDVPLLQATTVTRLERALGKASVALLTAHAHNPAGYGRVIRENGNPVAVVEHRDATAEQRAIDEINVGVYLAESTLLRKTVSGLQSSNAQQEFYLTDVVAAAAKRNGAKAVVVQNIHEVRGVNTRAELAEAERVLRQRLIAAHQDRGVMFRDPAGTMIGADVRIERDVVIGVGVQLYGRVSIGKGARLEGPSYFRDCRIGAGTTVHSFCHVEGADVGKEVTVGPFARLRPGAELDTGSKIGNFVEMKKARLGKGAKANHLAYLGDADIGAMSNVGAGTITCNYDGSKVKKTTTLGKGTFIGSNATLVAPLNLGDGAYVAAGSTVTRDVGKDALAFGRARQVNRDGYAARLRRLQKAQSKNTSG